MTIQRIDFLRGAALDAVIVRKLLIEQRDDAIRRQRLIQDKHQMIRFQVVNRGMSRRTAENTWGKEMVAEALDSEGIQTLSQSAICLGVDVEDGGTSYIDPE